MNEITVLCDYKGFFGSKYNASPYLSGFDKNTLDEAFRSLSYKCNFLMLSEVQYRKPKDWEGITVVYSSIEDDGYHYKDFIEDIILYLFNCGAELVPSFFYLRSHNNKVYMELLGKVLLKPPVKILESLVFGTFEEAMIASKNLNYPVIVKEAKGAMSEGVFMAKNHIEFENVVKRASRSKNIKNEVWEVGRRYKYDDYIKQSRFRNKFIVQNFIPGLSKDYKLLIFGDRYFIFERPTRKNDFRASGSGNKNYIYGSAVELPSGLLNYAKEVFLQLNVPVLSLDIGYNHTDYYIFEFQVLFFGTVGHLKSDGYYIEQNTHWVFKYEKNDVEYDYACAIDWFLKNRKV
jgi:glutathione synthase/RimK-type ligase-like ATP-grasp enzyme